MYVWHRSKAMVDFVMQEMMFKAFEIIPDDDVWDKREKTGRTITVQSSCLVDGIKSKLSITLSVYVAKDDKETVPSVTTAAQSLADETAERIKTMDDTNEIRDKVLEAFRLQAEFDRAEQGHEKDRAVNEQKNAAAFQRNIRAKEFGANFLGRIYGVKREP